MIAYGTFINTVINFVIVAFAVFLLVKQVNRLKRYAGAEEAVAPPSPPTADVVLLEDPRHSRESADRARQARRMNAGAAATPGGRLGGLLPRRPVVVVHQHEPSPGC